MATEVRRTIRAAGGDYPSLSAFDAGESGRDLVANDEFIIADCYNDWVGGLDDWLEFSAWPGTHNATNNITIQGADADGTQGYSRHRGIAGAGFHVEADPQSNVRAVIQDRNNAYVQLRHLSVRNTRSQGYGFFYGERNVLVDACIAEAAGICFRIFLGQNLSIDAWPIVRNSFAIDNGAASFSYGFYNTVTTNTRAVIENCIIYGCDRGVMSGTSNPPLVRNTVGIDCGAAFEEGVPFQSGSDNNASTDTSASQFTNNLTGVAATEFNDIANGDAHLTEASILRGEGQNLYSDFQFDIDEDEWPDTGPWDIGADYFVSAAAAPVLSNIEATGITQTSVTPQVDITFP